ncbi:EAL domain-containing protein [Hyphomicrobium sp.]|uniref:putative bifunctional diguanylate cyclase/phosphodiesterase n=1 Tax=Hyphomicrobium sp. TaxID=82 RepID=UPI000FBA76E9|nr:EAL domain-containing protein [Hyphomicrobium sp.]RUO97940.1 MAG: EAL domain-containing protein [Hyphomicrobium sp.]
MRLRSCCSRIRDLLSVQRNDQNLLLAQYSAVSKQVPLLYLVLLANTWVLAHTFSNLAPVELAFYVPAGLTAICLYRLVKWKGSLKRVPTAAVAFKQLSRTNRLSLLLALGFSSWAVALYPYGDVAAQAHVAFYMAITSVACIFCLMYLRSAALTVAIVVNAVFIVFFGLSAQPTFVAIALNMFIVTLAMIIVLTVNHRQLVQLVTARDNAQALIGENFKLANLDPLTGLPNRRQFFAHLDREFEHAKREGHRLAVGVMDLDGFKPVNDLYGHAVGDALLIEVGRRLREACGLKLHLARIGGDEFAVVGVNFGSEQELLAAGNSMCEALRVPFFLHDATVHISGSIGFAIWPDHASTAMALFERADYALFRSKRDERGEATLFSAKDSARIHRDVEIEQALHSADLERELSVAFQPIIEISTGKTIAFEALARWESPVLGELAPGLFIPVAERAGIISKLTCVLMDKAVHAAVQWPEHVRLSFNLSAYDIGATASVVRLVSTVLKSGFNPSRIDFEITETAIMKDVKEARETIEILQSLGCGISLDDFGTGYSSLTQLHSLPLTKIKIDRSFVADLHQKPAGHKIVKSLLALSRDMGLGCIVEGVETDAELDELRALGCTNVQGYRISPPLSEEEALAFVIKDRPTTAARRKAERPQAMIA